MFNALELKAQMTRKEMTQQQLSEKLGINRDTCNKKINGKTEWTLSEVQKLADILGKDNIIPIFFD